ncbi:MAG: SUMF1/EgtB/PvdO family nonheme iron enzyme [Nitrospirae bacterium]|nr:SUMF1/EgtB/PvdO family nonheme iron enzyme [Nitrospirota bacterium]
MHFLRRHTLLPLTLAVLLAACDSKNDDPVPPVVKVGTVEGKVTPPLAGAFVRIEGTSLATTTDAEGKFRLDLAPEGQQRLWVEHQDEDGAVRMARTRIVVEAERAGEVDDVKLSAAGSIVGHARLKERDHHEDVVVTVAATAVTARTDRSGAFSIPAVPADTYSLTFSYPGFGVAVRENIEVHSGEAANLDSVELEAEDDPDSSVIYGSIRGKITDGDDHAVAGAVVTTTPASAIAVAGEDGSYTLLGLFPVIYAVRAEKEGYVSRSAYVGVKVGKIETADIVLSRQLRPEIKGHRALRNRPPAVSLRCPELARPGEEVLVSVLAQDSDGDVVKLSPFSVSPGMLNPHSGSTRCPDVAGAACAEVDVTAPASGGRVVVAVLTTDGLLAAEAQCEIPALPTPTRPNACPLVAVSGPTSTAPGRALRLTAATADADGDPVLLEWNASAGALARPAGETAVWTAPQVPGTYEIAACGTDGFCRPRACGSIRVRVSLPEGDTHAPACALSGPTAAKVFESVALTVSATDADGDALDFSLAASGGRLSATTGSLVTWTAPEDAGAYAITCIARDIRGAEGTAQLGIAVAAPPPGKTCPSLVVRGTPVASPGGKVTVDFHATDSNSPAETLTGGCSAPSGAYNVSNLFATGGANFEWTAPDAAGAYSFHCFASNPFCTRSYAHTVSVVPASLPHVAVSCSESVITAGMTTTCTATASEQADFRWAASGGSLSNSTGSEVKWTSPSCARCGGAYTLVVTGATADGRANAALHTFTVLTANIAPEVWLDGPTPVEPGRSVTLRARAADQDGSPGSLTCTWEATGGFLLSIEGCQDQTWIAPAAVGSHTVWITASDTDRAVRTSLSIAVTSASANQRPLGLISGPAKVEAGGAIDLECSASDPEGKTVGYAWSATAGTFSSATGESVSGGRALSRWTAPNTSANVTITCTMRDDASPANDTAVSHSVSVSGIPSGRAYECDEHTLALYHFDETSGAVARDACGGRDGLVQGAALDHDGMAGRAFSFDGVDDLVKMASAPNPGEDSQFTLEAWFKLKCDCPTSGSTIVGKGSSGDSTFGLKATGAQQAQAYLTPMDRSSTSTATSVRTVNDDAWHHAAAAYDGRTLRLYLDATKEASVNVFKLVGARTSALFVGAADQDENGSADALFFKGWIDEIRISDIARAPQEFNVLQVSRGLEWAKRSGNPFLSASAVWELANVAYPSVVKVSSNYLMYYQGGTSLVATNIGEATSTDSITWKALPFPVVTIGSAGSWDAAAVQQPAVYYDGAKYWLFYGGKKTLSDSTTQLGLATSTNAVEFTKHASNPLLGGGDSAAWDASTSFPGSVVKEGGEFRLYYTGYEKVNTNPGRIGLATSPDGVAWTRYASNPILWTGDTGQFDDTSVQNPRVIKVGSLWYMFYEGVKKSGVMAIGLATSLNGVNWTKSDSNPVMSATHSWEVLNQFQGTSVILDGEQLKMYYAALTSTGAKIGMAFEIPEVFVPGGPFVMGSDSDEGLPTERPEHVVRLSPYWIDRFEVTNAAYKACVDTGPCKDPEGGTNSATRPGYFGTANFDNHPVLRLTWKQADQYCRWIGKRLPTEAEWEKAARGAYPDERLYPWGDSDPSCWPANLEGCIGDTEPVGARPGGLSPFGLYDMAGNIAEWVGDWADMGFYAVTPTHDPAGPATGSLKLVRGGSWNSADPKVTVRVSYREASAGSDTFTSEFVGFRCARDP